MTSDNSNSMKYFFMLFFTIVILPIYSQTGFYLHPSIEYKFDTNHNLSYDIITPQNYSIHVKARNFTAEKTIFMGLQLGYRSKCCFFETGWAQDKFASGITISATAYDVNKKSYYTKERKYYDGAAFNKIPLRFGIRLFGKDSVAIGKKLGWQAFVFGSLDVLIAKAANSPINDEFIINPQGDAVSYSYYPGRSYGITMKKTMGIMLKAYTKKGHNINFSFSYLASNFGDLFDPKLTLNNINFTNYDDTKYHAGVFSYGSGFYLSVSTDIATKNWFKKKREVDYYH